MEAGGRCIASLSPDLSEGFLETLSFIPLRIQIVRVLQEQPPKALDRLLRTQAHHLRAKARV
jgi:hypothetical protein